MRMSSLLWMRHRVRRRERRRSRGQALVETALFFTILMLLVAGAVDVSSLLNDHLNIVYAARQGARTGSVLGNRADADCAIIGAIQAAVANEPNLTLNQIIIYRAGADGRPVSADARNVYAGSARCFISGAGATISPAALSDGWPPSARKNDPFYEDSLGVQLDYTYTYQFQFIGSGTFTASDWAVMPLQIVGVPSPLPVPKNNK